MQRQTLERQTLQRQSYTGISFRCRPYRGNPYRAELIRANLTGAILAGADLTQTYLTGVNLAEADLREVRSSDIIGTPFRLPDGWSLVAGELIIDEGESSTTPAEENTIELGDDLSFNNIRTEINRVFDERRNYSLFKKIDITGRCPN